MLPPRKPALLVASFAAMIAATAVSSAVRAQADLAASYPVRPVRLVVGFAAGGGTDIVARIIGQKLENILGRTVVIENRSGAGGLIAGSYVAAQPPDGYTLLYGTSGSLAISPAINEKTPYKTTRDFVPIAMLGSYALIMVVRPDHPAKNVKEFVAWAKANPDKTNYGAASPAFVLATELFKLKSGAPATMIPYKGSNETVVNLLSRSITFAIMDLPPVVEHVKTGQLRALAMTSPVRVEDFPDVPTMAEAGVPDVNVRLWSGLFAPAGTPPAIVHKLEAASLRIAAFPDVKEKLRAVATNAISMGSQEFTRLIDEIRSLTEIAKATNVKYDP